MIIASITIDHAALMSMLHLDASLAGGNLSSMMNQNGIPTTAAHAEDAACLVLQEPGPGPGSHQQTSTSMTVPATQGYSLTPASLAPCCDVRLQMARQGTAQPAWASVCASSISQLA
jgi:hypothetical protein